MFEYDKNIPDPKRGDLLISEPFLPDPNFERTVILVCEHNEEGTFGLVLNKATDITLNDVMEEDFAFLGKLNLGGPVEHNTLHFLHRTDNTIDGAVELSDKLNWGGEFESIKLLIETGRIEESDIKFFIGYSGWGAGQLREELDRQSWFLMPNASSRQVFDMDADDLWKSVLNEMGGKYKVFSNYPSDPRLN
jgi:putative transcriptional regulator